MVFRKSLVKTAPWLAAKNASLGEMFSNLTPEGIWVPDGFAITAAAYRAFIAANALDEKIHYELAKLEPTSDKLDEIGRNIRGMVLEAALPPAICKAVIDAYQTMAEKNERNAERCRTIKRHGRRSARSKFCRTIRDIFECERRDCAVGSVR